MNKPERENGPLRWTDRRRREERPGKDLDAAQDSRRGACYLPTWGRRRRRLSVGLGVASRRVTGRLRA